MKKTILLSSLLLSATTFGQVELTKTDLTPSVGQKFNFVSLNTPTPAPTIGTGNNQTYDFSAYTATTNSNTTEYVETTNTSATIDAIDGSAVTSYSYTSNSAVILRTIVNNAITEGYSNSKKILEFPINSNTDFEDTYAYTVTGNQIQTINGSGTIKVKFKGSGTLITPTGTYSNVICLNRNDVYTATQNGGSSTITIDDMVFYKAGIPVPIARSAFQMSSASPGNAGTSLSYLSSDNLDINEINQLAFIIAPNPAVDAFSISGDNSILSVELMNTKGQLVSTEFDAQMGTVNISALAPGVYHARIQTATGVAVQKIIKQ